MEPRRSDRAVETIDIEFPGVGTARAAVAGPRISAEKLLNALDLKRPRPILLVIGGAKSLDQDVAGRLERLLERGAVRAAGATGAIVLDGGTQSGVMAVLGEAALESDAEATLLGVAPARLVTFPNDARGLETAATPLDPNHSCFVLANSEEWGGETSLLFDLLDDLSDSEPRVALLAGGGEGALEEVRLATERGMPIVVIEGTKGLADDLARSRSTAKDAPKTPFAAIAAEGDLTVVPLDSDPSDLERVLTRHLQVDETLRDAWAQQELVSEAATRRQAEFGRLQGVILTLGFTVTLLVVAQTVLDGAGFYGRFLWLGTAFYLSILAIPIVVTFLTGASGRFRPGTHWILLRGASETIKREIFRYRARAGIYSHANTRETPREVKLAEAVGSAIGGLMRTDVSQSALDPERTQRRRAEAARKKREKDAETRRTSAAGAARQDSVDLAAGGAGPQRKKRPDNRLARLTAAGYIDHRVSNQVEYYLRTARKQERQARWLRLLALAFGAIGTLLAALGLQIYVAATVALAAVYTTLVESRQLEASVTFYNQAAADLSSIRAWWNALPPSQQDPQETIDRLVDRAERIMRAEHIGWVQEMQDAMTQFRIEQSAEAQSAGGPAGETEQPSAAGPTESGPPFGTGTMRRTGRTGESGAAPREVPQPGPDAARAGQGRAGGTDGARPTDASPKPRSGSMG